VRWFIDQVTEHLARNPQAKFYFAGHSNGTYILGEALRRIPRLACSRVYVAASVLPRIFEWDRIIGQRKQAAFVRCDMGTEDWPVGVGCNTLNRLGMKTIGVGGFEGFEYGDKDHMAFNHFAGGHGAMLADANTGSIADFLLTGSPTETAGLDHPKPSKVFSLFRSWGDVLVPLVIAIVLALIVWLAMSAPYGPVWAVALLWLLWMVAGRF
jgi:pimeloyl-ACP methyl ester carboxylesterase